MLPPALLVSTLGLLICRLKKFFAAAPLIAPALSVTPVKMIVDAEPSMVPALATRSLPIVVVVVPKFVVAPALFNVRLKKVVFPVSVCVPVFPWKVTVPVPGVKVELLVQLPPSAKLKLPLAKVAAAIFRLPVIVVLPCNVLVLLPEIVRLLYAGVLLTVWLPAPL